MMGEPHATLQAMANGKQCRQALPAGTTIATLRKRWVNKRIVRAMPNTPAAISQASTRPKASPHRGIVGNAM